MTSKSLILAEAPTTNVRVQDLVAKKDAGYPEDPARNVYNGAQDPVATRAGEFGCIQIRELCSSMDKLGSANTTAPPAGRRLGANSLDQGVNSIGVEERLKRYMCEDEDGK